MTNKLSPDSLQPLLFTLQESTASLELFPAVWSALEDLLSLEPEIRLDALARLVILRAPRYSPLAAYLLFTRLSDPDLRVRAGIARALGEVLAPDGGGNPAPEPVRRTLIHHFGQLRTRQIFSLIQVLVDDPSLESSVNRLLNACPYAGSHLADILCDRKVSIQVREAAARAIGRVGFLDALPALERMAARLEARQNGQKTMPFAPPSAVDESVLLPAVHVALASLRAP